MRMKFGRGFSQLPHDGIFYGLNNAVDCVQSLNELIDKRVRFEDWEKHRHVRIFDVNIVRSWGTASLKCHFWIYVSFARRCCRILLLVNHRAFVYS